jgi:hypothetical protein
VEEILADRVVPADGEHRLQDRRALSFDAHLGVAPRLEPFAAVECSRPVFMPPP